MARFSRASDALKCSFCNRLEQQVERLIAGPGVYICDECTELCHDLIAEDQKQLQETERFDYRRSDHGEIRRMTTNCRMSPQQNVVFRSSAATHLLCVLDAMDQLFIGESGPLQAITEAIGESFPTWARPVPDGTRFIDGGRYDIIARIVRGLSQQAASQLSLGFLPENRSRPPSEPRDRVVFSSSAAARVFCLLDCIDGLMADRGLLGQIITEVVGESCAQRAGFDADELHVSPHHRDEMVRTLVSGLRDLAASQFGEPENR
jgi:hypothetical protein